MLNRFSRIILFTSSFLPLPWLIIIRNLGSLNLDTLFFIGIIGLITLTIFIVILEWLLVKTNDSIIPTKNKIIAVKSRNTEILVFILTYIVPLYTISIDLYSVISLILVLAILLLIYLRSNVIAINPILNLLFGYNIYDVEINRENIQLLSRKMNLEINSEVKMIKLDSEIYLDVGK